MDRFTFGGSLGDGRWDEFAREELAGGVWRARVRVCVLEGVLVGRNWLAASGVQGCEGVCEKVRERGC